MRMDIILMVTLMCDDEKRRKRRGRRWWRWWRYIAVKKSGDMVDDKV